MQAVGMLRSTVFVCQNEARGT